MNKKIVTIELCDHKKTYEGRLLGLIDDKQFHALMTRKAFQNKVFCCATVPLEEIRTSCRAGFNGLRLVLTIRKIDDKTVGGKHMFVTERLSYIGNEDRRGIGILGEEDELYLVEEK